MFRKLKIAFIVRSTLFKVVGGDNLQVINTAGELRKLGVEVDIYLASDTINYGNYDLLHLFNIIRPADHLYHIRKSGKPVVISTIYLDYTDFDKHERSNIQKVLLGITGRDGAEYLKNNFRFLKNQDKLVSKEYLLGHRKAVRNILENVQMLLPNSKSEYERLYNDYKCDVPYHVIPNGINKELFSSIPEVEREDNRVLCVGQIYGLKNQHRLIKAVNKIGAKLTIIGKSPPNHKQYLKLCKQIAGKNIDFIDFIPQKELLSHYARSRVHALPSWFETTGLSSLEAGVMGCNLVVGMGGDTKDYFSEKASFTRADDDNGIRDAVEKELNNPMDMTFREYILDNFTWEKAAMETFTAYKKVLNFE